MSLHPFRGVQSPTISYFEEGHYEFNFQLMPCCLLQTSSLFQHKLYMQENWHLLLNISAWSYRINIISQENWEEDETHQKRNIWKTKQEQQGANCQKNSCLKVKLFFSVDDRHFITCFIPSARAMIFPQLRKFPPIFHSLSPFFCTFFPNFTYFA